MSNKKPYTVKRYILTIVWSQGLVVWFIAVLLPALGFGWKRTSMVIAVLFPISVFAGLYGFYKGLVQHYGLSGEENLFFGGRF